MNNRLSAYVNNNKYDLDLLSGFAPLIEPIMNIKIIYSGGQDIIPADIQVALSRDATNKIPVTNVIDFLQTICTYTTANPTTLNKASQLLGTLDITVSEDMLFTLSKNYETEQSSNISKISKQFFTKLDETKKEQKEAQNLARIVQEEEERQRLIQANMPFKSKRLQKDIKESISKTKQEIISKSKSKLFTITDREGKKQKKRVVSRPLSQLQELSNSNSNSNEASS